MDITLLYILASTFLIALTAWSGVVVLFFSDNLLQTLLMPLVAFSAGSIMATGFFHFIPESLHSAEPITVFIWVMIGFCLFFVTEQIFNWQKAKHEIRTDHITSSDNIDNESSSDIKHKSAVSYLILIAGGIHNIVGGLAIGTSFLISPRIGLITTVAATAHHLPQEFGDFGILVHGGWKKPRAFMINFLSALTIVPGGLIAYYLSSSINTTLLLAFAAGNFIYISATDLVPEITHGQSHQISQHTDKNESRSIQKSMFYLLIFLLGIAFIIWTRLQL